MTGAGLIAFLAFVGLCGGCLILGAAAELLGWWLDRQ